MKIIGHKKSFNQSVEQGFTIGSIVMLILLIAVIFFSARFISDANNDNNKQAGKLDDAFGNNQVENDPTDDDYIPETPDNGAKEVDIRSVTVEIDTLFVTLVATLPGSYTGNCYAEVTNLDGSDEHRYTEPLEKDSVCRIYVPRDKDVDGHKFKMSYQSDDGKYFGTHPEEEFTY